MRVVAGVPPSFRRALALWRLQRCVFVEHVVTDGDDAHRRATDDRYLALTVDKGREIQICLDYEDRQALYFVLIHELAHVMSLSVGHTNEFHRNQERLLDSARRQNICTGSPRRVAYCGTHIHLNK